MARPLRRAGNQRESIARAKEKVKARRGLKKSVGGSMSTSGDGEQDELYYSNI